MSNRRTPTVSVDGVLAVRAHALDEMVKYALTVKSLPPDSDRRDAYREAAAQWAAIYSATCDASDREKLRPFVGMP